MVVAAQWCGVRSERATVEWRHEGRRQRGGGRVGELTGGGGAVAVW